MKVKCKFLAALSSFIDQATGPRDMASDGSVLAEIEAAVSRCIDGSKHGAGEERVHEILFLVSNAPGSITFLSRRLSARLAAAALDDDAAAVKTLLLLHRLLRGGDRYFEQDLRGMLACGELRVDLVSGARCAAKRNGFLLGYAAFLVERLGWAINPAGGLRPAKLPAFIPPEKGAAAAEWALYSLRKSQTFLDRAMDCLPENTSVASRAMQSAFNIVVKESIRVYESFSEEVEAVIAAYPDLDERSKSSAAEILCRSCTQTPSLYDFYESCKRSTADVIRKSNVDYPYVRIITAADVASMEHRGARRPTSSSGGFNRRSGKKESSSLSWKKLETTISTVWVVFEEEEGRGGGSQACRFSLVDEMLAQGDRSESTVLSGSK